jgi:hypothetical protein
VLESDAGVNILDRHAAFQGQTGAAATIALRVTGREPTTCTQADEWNLT